jgi:hypothetical protein
LWLPDPVRGSVEEVVRVALDQQGHGKHDYQDGEHDPVGVRRDLTALGWVTVPARVQTFGLHDASSVIVRA